MTLKEQLERIWNKPGVIHACNINLWKWGDGDYWWEGKIGPRRKVLVCVKGRRSLVLGLKAKGKGFSSISRNYYLYWTTQNRRNSAF